MARGVDLLLMAWACLAACQAKPEHKNQRTGYIGRPDPQDMDWYYGCADDDLELRGRIAADLDVEKFQRHVGFCLGHCNPPKGGCDLQKAEQDCNCLKCMMHCLNKGSYSDSCVNEHQQQVCELARTKIFDLDETQSKCNVDCSAAAPGFAILGPIAAVFIITAGLSWQ